MASGDLILTGRSFFQTFTRTTLSQRFRYLGCSSSVRNDHRQSSIASLVEAMNIFQNVRKDSQNGVNLGSMLPDYTCANHGSCEQSVQSRPQVSNPFLSKFPFEHMNTQRSPLQHSCSIRIKANCFHFFNKTIRLLSLDCFHRTLEDNSPFTYLSISTITMSIENFPQFLNLPPELRLMIWKMAIRSEINGVHRFSVVRVKLESGDTAESASAKAM